MLKIISWIFACIIFLWGQKVSYAFEQRASFPEQLYKQKDYYRTVTEVLRLQFFHPEEVKKNKLKLLLAKSYFHLEDYVFLKTTAQEILSGNADYTLEDKQDIAKYLTLAHLKEKKEIAAKAIWETYVVGNSDESFPLSRSVKGQVDPDRAGLYSAILPGTGMMLTGEYGKAAVSFLLNVGFLFGTYQYYHKDAYGIAALLLFFEIGWYKGGIAASRESAENYNRRLIEEKQKKWIEYHIKF